MRFRFLVLGVLFLSTTTAWAEETRKRPNVLFLFTDDQRADTIAALGNPHIRTPHLDALVRRGTALHRAYCMGAMQGAVCVPSRAMLLSGRSLWRAPSDLKGVTTWPEMFARAGYRTFMTGKWHNQTASALRCFMMGDSVFFGGMGSPYKLPVADISEKHQLTNKRQSGKHSVELFADSVIEFLNKQKGSDQPFLAYVSFNLPHDPRTAPKKYHAMYQGKNQPPLPPNFMPQHPFNNGEMVVRDEKLAPWPRAPEVVREHLADYYATITHLDDEIGRILEALRVNGFEENTIIVFTSDHGLALGSHGLFGKQNLYDHSMRAPLIMAGPGVPRNQQRDGMCYLFDIFATLGELTGVAAPQGNEGKSLVPVLRGQDAGRPALLTAYRDVQRAVRDERWHLIVYPQINYQQLFDLKNDPHELKNLADDPQHQQQVTRLTALLRGLQSEFGDNQALRSEKPQPREFDFSKVK